MSSDAVMTSRWTRALAGIVVLDAAGLAVGRVLRRRRGAAAAGARAGSA